MGDIRALAELEGGTAIRRREGGYGICLFINDLGSAGQWTEEPGVRGTGSKWDVGGVGG